MIEEYIKKIVENFDKLLEENKNVYGYSRPDIEAVWFYRTDHADSYEVDEEWLGVTRDGQIAWAYASGCSCWDGDFDEERCETVTMKEFVFKHEDMKAEWQEELKKFVEEI